MPAPPKPPRTPPKPRKPIARKAPLPRQSKPIARRTRVRPMSDRKRAEVRLRTNVTRPVVLKRDAKRCRACGFHAGGGPWGGGVRRVWLEVHEEPPRSLGGDPNDPADCITLCATIDGDGCHQKRTAGKLKIQKHEGGCNAPVTFREGDRTWKG